MKKLRTAGFICVIALVISCFSTAVFADAAAVDDSSTSSVTLNAVTLAEHTSFVSDTYFGVINLSVDDKSVVAATTDSQGRVIVSAIGAGTTKVRYWYRPDSLSSWTRVTLPITVSGTAAADTAVVETGLVFPQSSISIAMGSDYTVTGIKLNGTSVDASSLLWVASSGSVVTVEPNTGKITAVGIGTAVVYAIDPATKAAANINLSVT